MNKAARAGNLPLEAAVWRGQACARRQALKCARRIDASEWRSRMRRTERLDDRLGRQCLDEIERRELPEDAPEMGIVVRHLLVLRRAALPGS